MFDAHKLRNNGYAAGGTRAPPGNIQHVPRFNMYEIYDTLSIIKELIQAYGIKDTKDLQDALKDLLGSTRRACLKRG
ncbi:MAG: hypothetical protein ACOX3P_04380 [Saccharofermentanales bacterium]|jgi:hypothetical protein